MIKKKSFGWALLVFSFGASSHDIASIFGLHVEELHAIYYLIPAGVIGYILWRYG